MPPRLSEQSIAEQPRRGAEWFTDFVNRLQRELPNVSPVTLASVPSSVYGDAELRLLPGTAAAERWLARSNRTFLK